MQYSSESPKGLRFGIVNASWTNLTFLVEYTEIVNKKNTPRGERNAGAYAGDLWDDCVGMIRFMLSQGSPPPFGRCVSLIDTDAPFAIVTAPQELQLRGSFVLQ